MNPEVERNPVLEKIRSELLRAARQAEPHRRMRRRLVAVLIGLTALAGASAASAITRTTPLAHVLAGSDVPIPVPRQPVPTRADGRCAELKNVADGRAEPTVKRVDPRLRKMMGVFRRPQRPQEAVSNCGIELEDGQNFTLGRVVACPVARSLSSGPRSTPSASAWRASEDAPASSYCSSTAWRSAAATTEACRGG